MDKLAVLQIVSGDFNKGFGVILQIGEDNGNLPEKTFTGTLPSYPDFQQKYDDWQSIYYEIANFRLGNKKEPLSEIQKRQKLIEKIKLASDDLKDSFNNWFNSSENTIKEHLLRELNPSDEIRIIIEAADILWKKLPWQTWDFLAQYPLAEIAFSSIQSQVIKKSPSNNNKIKILAILGNSTNIDITKDQAEFNQLPNAQTNFLPQPQRLQISDQLWEEHHDILFFAGHSTTKEGRGIIDINNQESLELADLKSGLTKAIASGLQLAIFNSCDGLGLGEALADLHIPQVIVMGEPIPDGVAHRFLKYFLKAFSSGKSLYLAVREARERLKDMEDQFPCASWLPIIYQNPGQIPPTWQSLRGIKNGINWRELGLKAINQKRQLTTNPFTNNHGVELVFDEIYVPMGLVERKKKEKPKADISPEEGSQLYSPEKEEYEVTRTYKNDEFFQQVLQQGESPKSQGKRLAIIGEPGAGKTTLLQKIADWVFATTKQDVAIWVSLADLQGRSLEDYLLQVWLKNTLEVVQVTAEMTTALGELFKSGRVWLLLDGVDEMANAHPLYSIASQITGWVANAKVVLSCRLNVWDAGKNALQGFDVYRNLDFDYPAQVKQFIHKWFNLTPQPPLLGGKGERKSLAEQLLVELEQPGKERIRDLVKNPMRLMLLCFSWQKRQGSLPETKAGLYEQFVSALYEWKEEIFPTSSQQRKELNAALGRLALRGMEQSASRFRLRHGLVREVLGEVGEPLFKLALDVGWLNIVGVAVENPDENVYGFYHPTFQEYFAALAIDDWDYFLPRNHVDKPVEGKEYRIFEKEWNEVFLLWMGRENIDDKKEEFIKKLVKFKTGCNGDFYWYQAYLKAGIAIAEFKNCSFADEIIDQIIRWGFGYFDIEKQKWITFIDPSPEDAREILLLSDIQRVIRGLISLLHATQNENIRLSVAESLGQIGVGNKQAITTLIKLLQDTEDGFIRGKVADSLGKIDVGNKQAITALVKLLQDTEDGFIRGKVADSLGKIAVGNEEVITALITLLQDTKDKSTSWKVVDEVAYILGKIAVGNEGAITVLVKLLQHTEDEFTRNRVADILGKIAVGNEGVITALITLLRESQDESTSWRVSISLGQIAVGNEEAITALITLLRESQDEFTRGKVAYSLGKIDVGNEGAMAALNTLLQDSQDEDIRWRVTASLREIAVGNEGAIAVLIKLLQHTEDEDTRNRVADILGNIAVGNEGAIAALIKLLQHTQDESILLNVAYSLENIAVGNEQAITALIKLLQDYHDKYTRKRVAEILEKIAVGSEQAITALISLLHDTKNEDIFYQVTYTLNEIIRTKNNYLIAVLHLRTLFTREIYETNFYHLYHPCYKILWECAKNLTYPQFYQAWHATPTYHPEMADYQLSSDTTTINQLEQQYTDIYTLLQQLQPTNQTYPLPLKIQYLKGETDISIISQEICNLIYITAFPDADIPKGIDHPAKLTPEIQQIKKQFQKPNLALIFCYCEPYPELITFCNKLTNIVHIAWITDSKLEAPLKGFLPHQPNLLSAIQSWINEI